MRGIFLDRLYEKMEEDNSIFFLTADMGINLVEKFENKYPSRFLNVGIAEQNLIGVAAGLAESGMRPFVYTISNFLVHRCLEQIRNDIVLHGLPVVLVGTSTGYDNGPLGPTHHMIEDWGTISNLPKIKIFSPYNKNSAERIFNEVYSILSPTYVRIPKGVGLEDKLIDDCTNGSVSAVITYGSASQVGMEYAKEHNSDLVILEELGLGSFKTLDKTCDKYQKITVVEDHFSTTGMYSYLTQWVNSRNLHIKIDSVSPTDYSLHVGFEFKDFL